jgi:hypothetical protein
MKKICIVIILILTLSAPLAAADFGLLINQYAEFGNSTNGENAFEYKASIVPRFSFLVGNTGGFFTSASFTIDYNAANSDNPASFVPELLRTDFSVRNGALGFRAGRMFFTDPINIIAEGLFDGVQLTHSSKAGRFGLGAWYTGLLYKKTTVITMTQEERGMNITPLDYENFTATYFAPSRLLVSLDWEHLSIGEILQLKASVIAQADLSGWDNKLNSQYFTLKMLIPAAAGFWFHAGGSLETLQYTSANGSASNLAYACDLMLSWAFPVSSNSGL